MGITVKIDGIEKARLRIATMTDRVRDMTPFTKAAAETLRTGMVRGITQGVSPDATPFLPLAPATVARRRKGSDKPLLDTGVLRSGLFAQPKAHDTILFGVTGPATLYAPKQQFGDPDNLFLGKPAPVPARPFLPVLPDGSVSFDGAGWSAQWLERTMRKLKAWLEGGKT